MGLTRIEYPLSRNSGNPSAGYRLLPLNQKLRRPVWILSREAMGPKGGNRAPPKLRCFRPNVRKSEVGNVQPRAAGIKAAADLVGTPVLGLVAEILTDLKSPMGATKKLPPFLVLVTSRLGRYFRSVGPVHHGATALLRFKPLF